MAQKNKGVRTQHPEYVEMLPLWRRMRDVYSGTHELRKHTTEYLPKLFEEDKIVGSYQARLDRTVLYNSLYRTISGFVGMLMRVPAVLDAPPNTTAMMEDVTLTGIPLNVLAQEIADECLLVSRVGLYVNYPITSDSMTIADAQALNVRPYMSVIKAEQMINWRQRRVNNKYQLSMVTIQEEHSIPIDEFEDKEVTRYRVLDLDENDVYRVRIFEVQEKNRQATDVEIERFYPMMNGAVMNYIPLYIIGPDDITPDVDTPMMIDMADLCVAHFQAYSDLANGTHWSGIPTPIFSGFSLKEGESIHLGMGKGLVSDNPAARAELLEVGTKGFAALENQLNRLESQMITIGSRLLEQHRVQAESTSTAIIYRAGENSILSALSISVSIGITIALKTFAEWAGDKSENVKFTLNKEFFREPPTPEMLNALVGSMQGGMISKNAIFDYLQRTEFYPPDVSYLEEQSLIEADKPKPVTQPAVVTKISKNSDGSMTATR